MPSITVNPLPGIYPAVFSLFSPAVVSLLVVVNEADLESLIGILSEHRAAQTQTTPMRDIDVSTLKQIQTKPYRINSLYKYTVINSRSGILANKFEATKIMNT